MCEAVTLVSLLILSVIVVPYRPYSIVPQQAPQQSFQPVQNRPYVSTAGTLPYIRPPYNNPQQQQQATPFTMPQRPLTNGQQQFGTLYNQHPQLPQQIQQGNRPPIMPFQLPRPVQQTPQMNRIGSGGKHLIAGPLGKDGRPLFMRATPELQADWEM